MTTDRRTLLIWFVIGTAVAALFQFLQAQQLPLNGVLRVGAESSTLELISAELGSVPLTEGVGHDGQFSYVAARDPLALADETVAATSSYRQRRIAYPTIAGAAGLLSPQATVWGLVIVAALSVGAATAATAALAIRLGAHRWTAVFAFANLGLILSAQLVTADAFAIAAVLWAIVLVLDERTWPAVALFALAALAKEQMLLAWLGLIGFQWSHRKPIGSLWLVPVPLLAYLVWLEIRMGDAFVLTAGDVASGSNVSWPFRGIVTLVQDGSSDALVFGVFALAALVLALVLTWRQRSSLLWWLILPWVLVAVLAGEPVWGDGNNAARVFALVWILAGLTVGVRLGSITGGSANGSVTHDDDQPQEIHLTEGAEEVLGAKPEEGRQ